jgi:tetratricopeptide (TPR) repeat protein
VHPETPTGVRTVPTTKEIRRALLTVLLFVTFTSAQVVCAQETIKKNADTHESETDVADLFLWLHNEPVAQRYLDAAIKKNPRNPTAFIMRGKLHLCLGDTKLALNDYERAIELGYPRARGLERVAQCHFLLGQVHQGLDDCTEIIKLDPHSRMAYENRAKAFALLERPDLQQRDLKTLQSLSLSPGDYIGLANKERNSLKRLEYYRKALAIDPKFTEGWLRLAGVRTKEDPEEALAACNKALQIEPNSLIAYMVRAETFSHNSQFPEAVKDFSLVISYAPESKKALHDRASCYLRLGQADRALEDVNKLMLISKHRVDASTQDTVDQLGLRARVYFTGKDYQKALADCNQCIKLAGQAHLQVPRQTYFVRAIVYHALGNDRAAVQDFTRVMTTQASDNDAFYLVRGSCYLRLKEYQKALDDFNKAGADPDWAGYLYYLRSQCSDKLGNKQQALKDLQQSQKLGYTPGSKDKSGNDSAARLDQQLARWVVTH